MQSSIFYEPTFSASRVSQTSHVQNHFHAEYDPNRNFGRKETLSREVDSLPENHSEVKGNESRLFGFDQRVDQGEQRSTVQPLIPHYMKWEDYDSVRYKGNHKKNENESNFGSVNDISESNSTVF